MGSYRSPDQPNSGVPWYWVVYLVLGGLTLLGVLSSGEAAGALFTLWVFFGLVIAFGIWIIVQIARSFSPAPAPAPSRARTQLAAAALHESRADEPDEGVIDGLPRYCSRCGEVFGITIRNCPNCRAPWPHPLSLNETQALVVALTEFAFAREAGLIDEPTYRRLRESYEARLLAARPARAQQVAPAAQPQPARPIWPQPAPRPVAEAPVAHAAVPAPMPRPAPVRAAEHVPAPVTPRPHVPARAAVPPAPPKPRRELGPLLLQWTARRQADLLLYLGAFLLTISAIIFINYRGGALTGGARLAIFASYTLFFLGLGLGISHWKRVKEAAPVFVGLGAILTPLNFVVLWAIQPDTDRQLSGASIWLMGSVATAALCWLLAWRGYGRYYSIPASISTLVAWGAFAATIEVGWEWFGAWYAVTAVVATALAAFRFQRWTKWLQLGAGVLGFPAAGWAGWAAIVAEDQDFTRWQLPVTMALAAIACLPLGIKQRSRESLTPLAAFAAVAVGSAFWAAETRHLGEAEWLPAWVALASLGYVLTGVWDSARARTWAAWATFVGVAALGSAHTVTVYGDERAVLSAVYGLCAVATIVAWARWQWPRAGIPAPPLVAGAVFSGLWAGEVAGLEWVGATIAAVALGYVLCIDIQPRVSATWRSLALLAGVTGIGFAHIAAPISGTEHWQLVATYGVLLTAAVWDAARHREVRAWLFVPGLAAAGVTAGLWALEISQVQWAWPALGIAVLLVAIHVWWRRERALRPTGWAQALVLSAAPAVLLGLYLDDAWIGAAALATAGAVWLAVAVLARGDLFHALTGNDADSSAQAEQCVLSWGAAGWFIGATAFALRALEWEMPEAAWVFAGAAVACWLAVAALGRRVPVLNAIMAPAGIVNLGIAVAGAWDYEVYGQQAEMLAAALVAATLAVRPLGSAPAGDDGSWAERWRALASVCALVMLGFAHAGAVERGTEFWQLPAAYGVVVVALLWDALVVRNEWAWLGIPAATSAGLISSLWLLGVPKEHWAWSPMGVSVLLLAVRFWWTKRPALQGLGWPYALLLALAPVAAISPYRDEPWVGTAAFALAAAIWMYAALFSRGAIIAQLTGEVSEAAVSRERRLLASGSLALVHGAIAFAALALDATRLETAWSYAAFGIVAWLAVAVFARRIPEIHWVAGPSGVASLIIGLALAGENSGHSALMLGGATVAAALATQRPNRAPWQMATVVTALGGILFAHHFALLEERDAWQLPAAYGFAMVALLWNAIALREEPAWLGVPAVGSLGLGSLLYVLGVEPEHRVWPALGFAAAIIASERFWIRLPRLQPVGWTYALLLGATPLLLVRWFYDEAPAAGAANLAVAATVWAVVSWRMNARSGEGPSVSVPIALGSGALLFGATGFFNKWQGWDLEQSAISYMILGLVAWLGITVAWNHVRNLNAVLIVAGLAGAGLSTGLAALDNPGLAAITTVAGTLGAAQAIYTVRRWEMGLIVAAGVEIALAFTWVQFDWPAWTLAATYGVVAAGAFLGLAHWRDWGRDARAGVVNLLSSMPMVIAFAVSVLALQARNEKLLAGETLPTTPEWGTLAGLVLLLAGLVAFEGYRLTLPIVIRISTAIGLGGLLLSIAMLEPQSNQAYFAPVGVYLIGTALLMRRSEELFGPHMDRHEGILFAGMALIVGPAARDALQYETLGWSLWLIFLGFVLLVGGLVLAQRWLVVGGVLTIVGVGVRFYTSGGYQPPYWVTLGLAGALLVGGGLLLLAARDWWDRTRTRILHWWLGDADADSRRNQPPPAPPPPGPAAPAQPGAV